MQFNISPMVKNILFLNIGIFIIGVLSGINLGEIFGLRYLYSPEFKPFQIVTHMFMHANFGHLFSNMFALYMFGPMLENVWGAGRFLVFYMVCGIGAAVIYSAVIYFQLSQLDTAVQTYILHPTPDQFVLFIKDFAYEFYDSLLPTINAYSHEPNNLTYIEETKGFVKELFESRINVPMVGASGAIFGILMGFGVLFPNTVLMLLFPPIPLKAKYFVAIYGLVELFTGVHRVPGDNVAHFAHIGGMIFAFILIRLWGKQRNNFY